MRPPTFKLRYHFDSANRKNLSVAITPRLLELTAVDAKTAVATGRAELCAIADLLEATGPLVWNRHKSQLRSSPGPGTLPLIWAESITSDGRFVFRAAKRNHKPYFCPHRGDDWLIAKAGCVLVQRTTAKEQERRLIAAGLSNAFVQKHGGAVVENHLNMVVSTNDSPAVHPTVLAAFLNSGAADYVFRCLSGSVAVSAYELESMPLPPPSALQKLRGLVVRAVSRQRIDAAAATAYGLRLRSGELSS